MAGSDRAGSGPVDLDGRSLRYFIAVAEESNFTRAASGLHIAQQTLSDSVRQLERVVGVALLERSSRSVTLTPAGEEFLERARALVAGASDAVLAARQTSRTSLRRWIVGSPDWPSGIARFQRALSTLAVDGEPPLLEVSGSSWTTHLAAVTERHIDLGVTFLPHGEAPPAGMDARALLTERANWFLVGDAHHLADRDVIVPDDLGGIRLFLIRRSDGADLHDHLIAGLRNLGVDPVIEDSYQEGLATAVMHAGLHGAALWVVRSMTEPLPISTSAIELPALDVEVDLAVIWRSDNRHPALDAIVEAIAHQY